MGKKTILANVLALGMFLDSMKTWSESKPKDRHEEEKEIKKNKEGNNLEENGNKER